LKLRVTETLSTVDATAWNALAGDNPFLQHAFLHALHESDCASADTGWQPQYLLIEDQDQLVAAMPLYLKTHSYGEYVFDWSWADAYQRHGLAYYPKLLSAVPFTPVVGPRLLANTPALKQQLLDGAIALAVRNSVSSLHILFPTRSDLDCMRERGLLVRQGCQFHWRNANYLNFEDFLFKLSHDKRKKIRQERRKVQSAGITFQWLEGAQITAADWAFFVQCYQQTYYEHRSSPYLNLDFFERYGAQSPHNIVLICAIRDGRRIAASLLIRNQHRLYGRHWGALEHIPMLHFETCYYQSIEYAIAHRLSIFEGGAQGEHKMARGLLPVTTQSAHWLAHPEFSSAIAKYLDRETTLMSEHEIELAARNPFKQETP
jgi:hypothetical protein